MTGQDLWRAMSRVDPRLVEDAAAEPAGRGRVLRRTLTIAACLCLLLTGGAWAAEALWGVQVTDIFQGREESGFRVALEGETVSADDFSSPELTAALETIRQQYADARPWDSRTPGYYHAERDTWAACEVFLGVSLENPLEDLEGLENFSNSGSERAPHCSVSLYTTPEGTLSWIAADATYQTAGCKVQLEVNFAPEEGGMEPELRYLYDGEADFTTETIQLSDGREATLVTARQPDAKYSEQEVFFAQDGGMYNLRVWRWAPAELEEERMVPVADTLAELLELF